MSRSPQFAPGEHVEVCNQDARWEGTIVAVLDADPPRYRVRVGPYIQADLPERMLLPRRAPPCPADPSVAEVAEVPGPQ